MTLFATGISHGSWKRLRPMGWLWFFKGIIMSHISTLPDLVIGNLRINPEITDHQIGQRANMRHNYSFEKPQPSHWSQAFPRTVGNTRCEQCHHYAFACGILKQERQAVRRVYKNFIIKFAQPAIDARKNFIVRLYARQSCFRNRSFSGFQTPILPQSLRYRNNNRDCGRILVGLRRFVRDGFSPSSVSWSDFKK